MFRAGGLFFGLMGPNYSLARFRVYVSGFILGRLFGDCLRSRAVS